MNQAAPKQVSRANTCLYCLTPLSKVRFKGVRDRLGFVPGTSDYFECENCRSLTLTRLPTKEESATHYPPFYVLPRAYKASGFRRYFSVVENFLVDWIGGADARRMLQRLPHQDFSKVLEVGCGNGARLKTFARWGVEPVGFDFSKTDIAQVEEMGFSAVCDDIFAIDAHFAPESFDLIAAFDVFEHVSQLDDTVTKTLRLLRPGGALALGFPSPTSQVMAIVGKHAAQIAEAPRHVTVPSPQGATELLRRFGLQEIEIVPYSALSCSLALALSLFPGGSAAYFYRKKGKWGPFLRLCGGLTMLLSAPLFALENRFTKRPSRFIVLGRKPLSS